MANNKYIDDEILTVLYSSGYCVSVLTSIASEQL